MSDEINAGTGPNIVLRDHDDTPVEHEFPANLQVDTADGGTTKYVHESLVAEPVEKTVKLDFSGGDMVVVPEEGQTFSTVNIPVPANLIPENIAEGVNIAGVMGTLAVGGHSGRMIYPFLKMTTKITGGYTGVAYKGVGAMTLEVPPNATILDAKFQSNAVYTIPTSGTATLSQTIATFVDIEATPDSDGAIAFPGTTDFVQKVYAICKSCFVTFTIPEVYAEANDDGSLTLYTTEGFEKWPWPATQPLGGAVSVVDMSQSKIETLSIGLLHIRAHTVILPRTLTALNSNALYNDTIKTVDASRCVVVPAVDNQLVLPKSPERILVPAALYDEWIAAPYWADFAACIVAV